MKAAVRGFGLVTVLMLCTPPAASAAPLAFIQTVKPEKVELGEPFVQELQVTHAPEERYELRLPRTGTGAFELVKQERQREDPRGQSTTRFQLTWAVFALGKQPLPAVAFEVFSAAEKPARFTPPPPEITAVESLPPDGKAPTDPPQPYDIRPPVPLAVRTLRLVYWALLLIAAALLGAWGWRRYRRWKATRAVPPAPPLPLALRTQMALDALKNEKLPEKGRGREFYFRLSELARSYLGERYRFEALECTSEELLEALTLRADAVLPLAEIEGFIRASDWVKYAQAPAELEGCRQALAFVHRLVQVTRPTPVLNADRT